MPPLMSKSSQLSNGHGPVAIPGHARHKRRHSQTDEILARGLDASDMDLDHRSGPCIKAFASEPHPKRMRETALTVPLSPVYYPMESCLDSHLLFGRRASDAAKQHHNMGYVERCDSLRSQTMSMYHRQEEMYYGVASLMA